VRAAASHTGALAGVDPVLDAAYRRAGVLRVETIEELFDMSEVLAKQPRPRGPRLAIVTNAGGPAAIAADSLVLAGGELGPLAPATVAALAQALPAGGAHGNPVDLLGDADAGRYAAAIEAVSRDPGCDGVLAILTPQAMTDATEVAARLKAAARLEGGKPLLACWMGGAAVEAGEAILNEAEIPTFKYPDRAARAFAHMWRYSANLQALYETPSLLDDGRGGLGSRAEAERLLRAIRRRKRTLLSTHESKQVLAAYGIPTVPTRLAATVEEAVARAAEIGYPVVLKLHSETVTHKDELGGVRLDLRDAAAVRQAWHAIKRSVTERAGAEHFLGVTVERMAPPGGFELLLGSSLDLQLGPVLVFGAGGRLVEIVGDQAFGLPPLNSTLALRLMETTRIFTALRGGRGVPPVDLVALGQTVVRFSQLVAAEPWMREIEINPLYASPDAVLALDARITLHDPAARAEQLPTPVIRPYPQQYATTATLRDGTPVTIRPIRPEDEPMMVKFHETLSDRSVYYRYFRVMSLDQRVSHARLARLCFVDYAREMALVTVHEDAAHHRAEIIGVGRLCRLPGTGVAEFAVVVSDGWQRRGLGTRLLTRLVDIGRKEGLARITGAILTDNVEMQRVCERVGFTISRDSGGESRAEIVL
jgi:acetyltransferase